MLALLDILVLAAVPAAAQAVSSSSVSPSTYTRVGQQLVFTISGNSGSRAITSISVASSNNIS